MEYLEGGELTQYLKEKYLFLFKINIFFIIIKYYFC